MPANGRPFRWRPGHGVPLCILEWVSQNLLKALAYFPIWATLWMLAVTYVYLFGIPFVEGK